MEQTDPPAKVASNDQLGPCPCCGHAAGFDVATEALSYAIQRRLIVMDTNFQWLVRIVRSRG